MSFWLQTARCGPNGLHPVVGDAIIGSDGSVTWSRREAEVDAALTALAGWMAGREGQQTTGNRQEGGER